MSRPNVLLVVLDSVRAKNVGLYGHHRDTTPFLSSYADGATTYRQARSPGIHSVASHASLWTGAAVEEHGITRHEDRLRPETTVWEELSALGYRTGVFTVNSVLAHASNLTDPFDHAMTQTFSGSSNKPFPGARGPTDSATHDGIAGNLERALRDEYPLRSLYNGAYHLYQKRRGSAEGTPDSGQLIDGFLGWATGNGDGADDRPWAACLNLMDAHFPYDPAERYDRWGGETLRTLHAEFEKPPANEFVRGRPWWQLEAFEHLYDGAIRQLDAHLEGLFEGLEDAGVHEETLVVLTSDHGEGFGEISRLTGRTRLVDHSWGIHEVLTHVPLVVSYPGQTDPVTVDAPATLAAFPDTVRAALDGSASRDSFVPEGPVVASTERLLTEHDGIFEGSTEAATDYYGPWRAVYERSGDHTMKYAVRGEDALALRIRDAREAIPVDRDGSKRVEDAFAALESMDLRGDAGTVEADVEDRLADLGYLR
ncbi:sulfatase-like hydrolase/transferase [Natronomonas sp. LN261]|uniref:sulfatase-like hydrolase/transferase n=1 Tax=Natronomonas sp. LN261 TaxID=2750669 RepID=UPI0015EEA463|nr:sulfatase-like hydrolase/transferase [Natronomonas sp. LN261]